MLHNILELYQSTGLALKRKTTEEYCGPCPGCGGTDRFNIFPGQAKDGLGRFWCRQCGKSGDAIQFLQDFKGLTFRQASKELGKPLGTFSHRTMPRAAASSSRQSAIWEPKNNLIPVPPWQSKAKALVEWTKLQLDGNKSAQIWLARERGLSLETVQRFGLGWFPQDLYRDRAAWGLPPEKRPDGGPKKLWLPSGLVIPVFDSQSRIKRVKFRRQNSSPNEPKYLPLPQAEPKNTGPLLNACGALAWIVVESELDGLLLAQEAAGLVNIMALGSAAYRPDYEAHTLLCAAGFILLALDFDEAGNKTAWTWWQEHYPAEKLRVWPVPEGKDPCEAWRLGWNLKDWIAAGLPPAFLPQAAKPFPLAEQPQARPDSLLKRQIAQTRTTKRGGQIACYRQGRVWICEHLAELLAKGWTRAGLFRSGRFKYPCGDWGLAWSSAWGDSKLTEAEIRPDGTIHFNLQEHDRIVIQSTRPR